MQNSPEKKQEEKNSTYKLYTISQSKDLKPVDYGSINTTIYNQGDGFSVNEFLDCFLTYQSTAKEKSIELANGLDENNYISVRRI